MRKLLLTGASGFLGWNIYKAAQGDWQIHGITHNSEIDFPEIFFHKQNLADFAALRKLFGEIKPEAVIHVAAVSDANYCQQHPQETHSVNVDATVLLAELCTEQNVPFVFTSSDLVFDGKKGNYNEDDAVNPVSTYGEQKAEAERLITKIYPQSAICRMPLMVGDGGPAGRGYLHSLLSGVRNGEPQKLFIDEYRSPLGGMSAAKGLLLAVEKFKGIYHLAGKERLSRFQLGEKIAEAFQISKTLFISVRQNEMKMSAPRPADVSLDSSKAYSQGFSPEPIGSELLQLSGIPSPAERRRG